MQTPLWYSKMASVTEGRPLATLDVPTLSLDERDRRWAALREKMYFRRLDALVLVGTDYASSTGMANVRYVTQFGGILGATVVFPLDGDPTVFFAGPHMHIPFAGWRQVPGRWVDDVRPDSGVRGLVDTLGERGIGTQRIGVVGYRHMLAPISNISAGFLEELRRALPNAVVTDETAIVDELRLIKSDEELDFLRRAGAIARKRIARLVASARPGTTEAEVWAGMEYEGVVNGAEPGTFNLFSAGSVLGAHGDAKVQGLLHGSEVPYSASLRELEEGDLIICEFHTSYGGYLAGTEFSVFVGEPPEQLARVHAVATEIIRMAKELFVPDRPVRDVYSALHQHVVSAGLDFVELGFHGHGLASPEFPTVVYREPDLGVMGQAGIGNIRLRENMVFGLNCDLHDPTWRRDVGVMLGDMVAVRPGGAEYLCDIPLDVFAVPVS
jgi:Xaa-Pro aminopeptidase